MEHADRIFYRRFRCHTLYGLYNDFLCLGVGIKLCLIHYFVYISGGICACLVFQTFHKTVLCFFSTKPRKFLQLGTFLQLHFVKLFLLYLQQLLLIVYTLLLLIHFLLFSAEFFLTLIERNLALLQPVLTLLYLLVTRMYLFFKFSLLVKEFLLYLKQFLFFQHFRFLIGGCYQLIVFSFYDITENNISAYSPYNKGYNCGYNTFYHLFLSLYN